MDFLREAVRLLAQHLMELEVSRQIGAERHERTPERVTHRNGYRPRLWDTRVGTIELRVPKLRQGSYFPSLLEPRRRAEKALVAVVQEAFIHGVSTRKVDELVQSVNANPKGDHRANQNGTHPEHHARHWSPAPSGEGRDNSDINQPTAHATAASRGIGTTPR